MKIQLTAAALCLLALPALAQDKPKEPAAPAMSEAEMKAMETAAAPGEPHKRLARQAGDWTYTSKMWMAPDQAPAEWNGTMHAELILGGRYVQSTWKGNMMGMDFEGRATEGYDNLTQKQVGSWVDNLGTGIILSTGTCDASGNRCSTKGDMMDPMTGKPSYMRTDVTWMDANTFKSEMYGPGPDGKEFKWMEMLVKRK